MSRQSENIRSKEDLVFYNCKKPGHISKDCRTKKIYKIIDFELMT